MSPLSIQVNGEDLSVRMAALMAAAEHCSEEAPGYRVIQVAREFEAYLRGE